MNSYVSYGDNGVAVSNDKKKLFVSYGGSSSDIKAL